MPAKLATIPVLPPPPSDTGWQQGEGKWHKTPQEPPPAAAAVVVRGEMAARIDRLPLSWMQWEIALIVQLAWAAMLATDGPALRLYPFIWERPT